MDKLATVLSALKTRASAEVALIASVEGLALESVSDAGVDLDALAAHAASSIMVAEQMGGAAPFGTLDATITVYQGKVLVIAPLGPAVAVLVGSGKVSLGGLLLHLMSSEGDLRAALQEDLHSHPQPRTPSPDGDGKREKVHSSADRDKKPQPQAGPHEDDSQESAPWEAWMKLR